MGAVKRTHKKARCGQVSEKYAKRLCDRHGIRPRTVKAYLKATRPAWYNALEDWSIDFAEAMTNLFKPVAEEIVKAALQYVVRQTEVDNDGKSTKSI